ncbi:MAG: NAD+ synthase [Gammaproteobacteria bacterium]
MRIALAQLNFTVGDVDGNTRKIIEACRTAATDQNAHLVVFPELALTGYPPEDLLLRPDFLRRVDDALNLLCKEIVGVKALVGAPVYEEGCVFNSALLIDGGVIQARYDKQCLPNYGVFDEARYFEPGAQPCIVEMDGCRVALSVCEDAWCGEPLVQAAKAGANLLVNINASPFDVDKPDERLRMMRRRVSETGLPMVYLNLVGGQDELVFDGGSFVLDRQAELVFQAKAFEEAIHTLEFNPSGDPTPSSFEMPKPDPMAVVYQALVTGVRDYVGKNGFSGAVLGLSGGIDSALTLAIAADALGPDAVDAVMMPSAYTSDMSLEDAEEEAKRLGVSYRVLPIAGPVSAFGELLAPAFEGMAADVTEENIQARSRGVILMALSNKLGRILLTTGNKSEMAVGYATLYGDMAGGFAPLKDCPKTLVYALSEYRNTVSEVIPRRVIERPPSAELRPDQKDSDSLPDYAVLDPLLERFVEQDASVDDLIEEGFEEETVRRVSRRVLLNEYKRRQAPPGVRVTTKAFGRDRRYPISSRYRG